MACALSLQQPREKKIRTIVTLGWWDTNETDGEQTPELCVKSERKQQYFGNTNITANDINTES